MFFRKFSKDIKQLKLDIQEAINLVQKFKSMEPEEIIRHEISEDLLKWLPE